MLTYEEGICISRGSTFRLAIELPPDNPIALTTAIYVTFSQDGKEVLTKNKTDLSITTGNKAIVLLSQVDTLKFRTGKAYMQFRAKMNNGDAIVQQPMTELTILGLLKDGKI